MCWSGEASAVLAAVGLTSTVYAAVRQEPAPLWAALGYFSLMEALQAFTYIFIDECASPANQIATYLGYLHIAFQPFFGNWLFLHFVPHEIKTAVKYPVFILCAMSAIFMLIQVYPFDWAGTCAEEQILCAKNLCSVSGRWHIAWNVPYNDVGDINFSLPVLDAGFFTYSLTMFVLPFLYGSWRINTYHIVVGPLLARALTDDLNEFAAVWCLLSIGFLLVVAKTPLRRYLYVNAWPLWPKRLCRGERREPVCPRCGA